MGEINLFTRGDDLGSSKASNLGIMEAYEKGVLKNTSVMATCPHVMEAAELFKDKDDICFGVHLTMNAEWDKITWGPVLSPEIVPSLTNSDNEFFANGQLLKDNNPSAEEMLQEMTAQLDLLCNLGFDIKYADLHMGFSWVLDGFDQEVRDWCAEHGILYLEKDITSLQGPDITDEDPIGEFVERLRALEPGNYMLVGHPCVEGPDLWEMGHEGYEAEKVVKGRLLEKDMFINPRVLEVIKEKNIKVKRFDEYEETDK